jgi:hypothetical protein
LSFGELAHDFLIIGTLIIAPVEAAVRFLINVRRSMFFIK